MNLHGTDCENARGMEMSLSCVQW